MNNKETLEQAAEKYAHNYFNMHETNNYKALKQGFIEGAKYQAERMYSKEDLEVAYFEGREGLYSFNDCLEEFKKK